MGDTVYYAFYPKECFDNPKVVPYINECPETGDWHGEIDRPERAFFLACYEYGKYNEDLEYFAIDDVDTLMRFAKLPSIPSDMADYISDFTQEDPWVFIIWSR